MIKLAGLHVKYGEGDILPHIDILPHNEQNQSLLELIRIAVLAHRLRLVTESTPILSELQTLENIAVNLVHERGLENFNIESVMPRST
jgi:hypothetical protein